MGTEKYFLQKTLYLYEKYQIYLRRRFQASLKSKTFIAKSAEKTESSLHDTQILMFHWIRHDM